MTHRIRICLALAALVGPLAWAEDKVSVKNQRHNSSDQARANNPMRPSETWNDLRDDIVGDTLVSDGSSLFDIVAPHRAPNPATVPVALKKLDSEAANIKAVTLVIDENPAPVAADIRFGDSMAPLNFSARVRVNVYSNVRAIAYTDDGAYMHGKFVKAAGGCSAPAISDPQTVAKNMGKMRARHFGKPKNNRRSAQIMIRHPNFSGLQRDQATHLHIAAHFIDKMEVYQGDDMLFVIEGGISISENPVFRFDYTDNGSETFQVRARDTEGNLFEAELAKNPQT